MTSISEQLSAARTSQLEAQLDWMRVFAAQAFHSAEQVAALNLDTSRAAVARSTEALRQLLSATDPRDLFTLGSHTQEQLQHMFDYGQALMRIAAGARDELQRGASPAPASAPPTQTAPAVVTAPAATPDTVAPVAAPPTADPVAVTAAAVADVPAPAEPPAAASPIAKAVRRVAAKPAATPRPVASEIAIAPPAPKLPRVKPVDAPAPAKAAPASAQPPLPGIKAARATRKTTRK